MGAAYSDGMSTADNLTCNVCGDPIPQHGPCRNPDCTVFEEAARGVALGIKAIALGMFDDEDPDRLEYPNELARRAARGLGASTHKPPADDPAPS
jgi:hypothetical protein